jgi:hypothetical protein
MLRVRNVMLQAVTLFTALVVDNTAMLRVPGDRDR